MVRCGRGLLARNISPGRGGRRGCEALLTTLSPAGLASRRMVAGREWVEEGG